MSPIINEFRPNQPLHPDPTMMTIELRGLPGKIFYVFITLSENDNGINLCRINDVAVAQGAFSYTGILTFDIRDIQNPSFTVLLSSWTPRNGNDMMMGDANGHIEDRELFRTMYDAIVVPEWSIDGGLLFAKKLGGTNLKHVGNEPTFFFRDRALFRENEFNGANVLLPTFGQTNATHRSSASSLISI